ncbi:MAG: diphosphatase [Gammaproteobacteria bacterium]|jgi:NAD+ diphosphatase|nr:diphosphatase [Gammaproteobacteria bacterium]
MEKFYIVLAQDHILLTQRNDQWQLPKNTDLTDHDLIQHFTLFDQKNVGYIICQANNIITTNDTTYFNLRETYKLLGEMLFKFAGRARQILDWKINHIFCGRCGHKTEFFDQNRAKKCFSCGLINYPKISPCILVAITRSDEILLAQHVLSPRQGTYSILAGFVEPGESIEGAAHREVFEEVGLKIKNLHYIASQSWPFPNQLMCGFMAEYESGEIKIDKSEITNAKWFHKDNLPSQLPGPMTLSFKLIEKFLLS